jgi:hypothetical protein
MVLRMQLTMSVGKNKILLFLKLPPPTTGATLMNQYLNDSKKSVIHLTLKQVGIFVT